MEVADPIPEGAGDWLKRLLLQLADRAAFDVEDLKDNPEEALHRLRLRMKKAEALLKLSKGALGKTRRWRLRKQMRAVKNAGGAQRDAEVIAKLATELGKKKGLLLPQAPGNRTRPNPVRYKALLSQLRRDLAEEIFEGLTWDDVRDNYAAGYRAGRRCMWKAEQTMQPEDFHLWRKRVKATYYQTQALAYALPHPRHRLQRSKKLAKLLGCDHDLTLLEQETSEKSPDNPWQEVIAARRAKLRPQILARGTKMYGQPSHRFARMREMPM